jgi:hypothetical protein
VELSNKQQISLTNQLILPIIALWIPSKSIEIFFEFLLFQQMFTFKLL